MVIISAQNMYLYITLEPEDSKSGPNTFFSLYILHKLKNCCDFYIF